MTQDSLITPAMRDQIGVESEPWTCEVDRTQIRLFARSVGYTDAVFYDVAAARAAGYRDLPAPAGYLGTPVFNPARPVVTRPQPEPSRPLNRRLNGGTEIEYLGDICAGDVLTVRSHLADVVERQGTLGPMLISTTKTVYRGQSEDVVAIATGTSIRY